MLTNLDQLYSTIPAGEAARRRAARIVSWLPLAPRYGVIVQPMLTLFGGGTCVLMSPTSFLLRPVMWMEAISR